MNVTKGEMLRIVTDRRLKAVDIRILMYLISTSDTEFNQQDLADLLDVTRENLNRSIQKLKAFGYLKLIKSNAHLNDYEDYIETICVNIANNEKIEIRKKIKSNKMIYKADLNIVTQMKLEQVMELCNIDVKNSKDKFMLEDDAEIDFDTVADTDFTPYCVLHRRSDVFDLFELYKLYNEKIYSMYLDNNSLDSVISIDDVLLFLSCTELFRNDFTNDRMLDIIANFRKKYLDKMIAHYMNNTDILDKDFFLKYNRINKEFIANRKIKVCHIMRVLGYTNRETSRVASKFKSDLTEHNVAIKKEYTFIECLHLIKKLNKPSFYKDSVFNMELEDLEDIYL